VSVRGLSGYADGGTHGRGAARPLFRARLIVREST
jgi:hypothetical protein